MTPEELVFNSITISPRGAYVSNPSQYYAGVAQQERNRQWNIAKAYMQTPSLPNVINAIGAAWNALPFNTNAETVNPHINTGAPEWLPGFSNKDFTRILRTLKPVQTNTDKFVKFLQQRTGKTVTRVPIKDSKIGDVYSRGYSYVDENGKEIAHIAGNKKPEGVFVESSYVSPEYRSQGIGKQMYFDFNERTFNELGSTLRSSPYQHQATLETEPGSGVFISPSSKLWRGLKANGLAEIGGSGLNRYYMMAEPSVIKPLY